MTTKTIIAAGLGVIGLCATTQGASNDPWRYYQAGGEYKSAYTTRYDSNFGMSIQGVYSFTGDNALFGFLEVPDLGGAELGIHANIQGTSVFHEISLNMGYLSGSKSYSNVHALGSVYGGEIEQRFILFNGKYTLNLPISDSTSIYVGAKLGIGNYKEDMTIYEEGVDGKMYGSATQTKGYFGVGFGCKFAIGESTDFVLGYEANKYFANVDIYHTVTAGFSWSF